MLFNEPISVIGTISVGVPEAIFPVGSIVPAIEAISDDNNKPAFVVASGGSFLEARDDDDEARISVGNAETISPVGSAIDDDDGAAFPVARGIAIKVVPDAIIPVGDIKAAASPVGSAGDTNNGTAFPVARGSDAIISVVVREIPVSEDEVRGSPVRESTVGTDMVGIFERNDDERMLSPGGIIMSVVAARSNDVRRSTVRVSRTEDPAVMAVVGGRVVVVILCS